MRMGSGRWFKNIISKKKVKGEESQRYSAPQTINVCNEELCLVKEAPLVANGVVSVDNQGSHALSIDAAATKIQTSYRAYSARRSFHRIRGTLRLQNIVDRDSVKNQASTTLSRLHSWSKTQAQIRTRRAHMVTEGRLKQKKLENQLKLDAKIHDLEWNGGSDTKSEALAKIHHREEAAVRRERAMAYAFTHQWRANSTPSFGSGNQELNWGWSWMDRWITARPWESRVSAAFDSPKNVQIRHPSKALVINTTPPTGKVPEKVKQNSPNGKVARKACKLSYEAAAVKNMNMKIEEKKLKNEKENS